MSSKTDRDRRRKEELGDKEWTSSGEDEEQGRSCEPMISAGSHDEP